MSNVETTKLYETIIEDVINDSRQDFENNGIDESTLQDLRRIWCEKLTQSQVAKFAWDEEEREHEREAAARAAAESRAAMHEAAHSNILDINDTLTVKQELSYGAGLELPHIQDHDSGLMLPNIGQSDGTFEFTMYTDDNTFIDSLKKKEKKKKKIVQADGALDEEDDDDEGIFNDSDDINSDLDDDLESEKSDEDDGDQEGQIMLCLYDKVQRIKNKWKSNLKEGIANIDGKDYVFQKASGESEW